MATGGHYDTNITSIMIQDQMTLANRNDSGFANCSTWCNWVSFLNKRNRNSFNPFHFRPLYPNYQLPSLPNLFHFQFNSISQLLQASTHSTSQLHQTIILHWPLSLSIHSYAKCDGLPLAIVAIVWSFCQPKEIKSLSGKKWRESLIGNCKENT